VKVAASSINCTSGHGAEAPVPVTEGSGRYERGAELIGLKTQLRRRDDDRSLALEESTGVHERGADEPSLVVVPERVALRRFLEPDRLARITDAEVSTPASRSYETRSNVVVPIVTPMA
jgi:hypothetical protein